MPFDFSPESLDREFPVRRSLLYFNHAAVAPLPRRVADAAIAHTEEVRDRGGAGWRDWYRGIDRTREKAAKLIGARRSEIAFAPNTTLGLSLVAQAFPWMAGDNVVGDDMEFPSNYYPWKLLEQRRGIEFRAAKSREGRIAVEDIAEKVDARTRVVAVSFVAFHNGFVYPLREIGQLCRERGILFVVDAIQGLGALPVNVEEMGIDVLAADGHKWLLAAEGCAILYVSERARERLPPPSAGWWSTIPGERYLDYRLEYHLGARRYEPGTLPTGHVLALSAALDLLAEIGPETVRDRVLGNVRALADGLGNRGWRITSPELSSGILAAAAPGTEEARSLAKRLEAEGVIVSPREGAMRFSPHVGNDAGEIARLWEILDRLAG